MNRVEGGARPSGLLLLSKPCGLTSFQALGPVKRRLGTTKVGHSGTLDRFASGLLVVLVGPYARLADIVQSGVKLYRGRIRFGSETDTLDPEGTIVAEAPPPSREAIEAALPAFRGPVMQKPPAYSALHLDGKRAYERALAGEIVDLPPRPVVIYALELESFDGEEAVVVVRCSAGTYVRSLARDLALASNSRAHLLRLERLAIGPFHVENAKTAEDFDPSRDLRGLSPAEARELGLDALEIAASDVPRFRNGANLGTLKFAKGLEARTVGQKAVFDPEGRLLGVVTASDDRLSYCFVIGDQ